jgi:hypothetical protein
VQTSRFACEKNDQGAKHFQSDTEIQQVMHNWFYQQTMKVSEKEIVYFVTYKGTWLIVTVRFGSSFAVWQWTFL